MTFQKLVYESLPIETERLKLIEIDFESFLKLGEGINSEPASLLTCRPINKLHIEDIVKHFEDFRCKDDRFTFSVIEKENNNLIGRISLFDYNSRNKAIEIGYFIFKEFRNKRYASEIIDVIKKICFEKLEINKIIAQTGSFNEKSIKLLEKSGFCREGTLREHHEKDGVLVDDYIYSILKNEYIK